jgi:hypothetical protein
LLQQDEFAGVGIFTAEWPARESLRENKVIDEAAAISGGRIRLSDFSDSDHVRDSPDAVAIGDSPDIDAVGFYPIAAAGAKAIVRLCHTLRQAR